MGRDDSSAWSRLGRSLRAAPAAILAAAKAFGELPAALGARPSGERARRVLQSPHYRDGTFHNGSLPGGPVRAEAPDAVPAIAAPANATPAIAAPAGATTGGTTPGGTTPGGAIDFARPRGGLVLREMRGKQIRKPTRPVPIVVPAPRLAVDDGLSVVWFGHATALVEVDGGRVLFDPVWSQRCSPFQLVGPRRLHPTPIAVEQLQPLDAIVISHDHYDHLDMATVRALTRTQTAPFLVPIGVGAHLDRWGVPSDRIIELDWDEGVTIAGLRITVTAAHHFSGRTLKRNPTLWGSWVIAGPTKRLFYTGDSGYFPGYADIGSAYGPFDVTLVQVGAYSPAWPDIHMTPEEAIAAHLDLRGDLLIPVHWATFVLAFHAWDEPVDRLWLEAKARDVRLVVPRPGEWVDSDNPPAVDGWWQTLT